jgi:hypothetical protein
MANTERRKVSPGGVTWPAAISVGQRGQHPKLGVPESFLWAEWSKPRRPHAIPDTGRVNGARGGTHHRHSAGPHECGAADR